MALTQFVFFCLQLPSMIAACRDHAKHGTWSAAQNYHGTTRLTQPWHIGTYGLDRGWPSGHNPALFVPLIFLFLARRMATAMPLGHRPTTGWFFLVLALGLPAVARGQQSLLAVPPGPAELSTESQAMPARAVAVGPDVCPECGQPFDQSPGEPRGDRFFHAFFSQYVRPSTLGAVRRPEGADLA